MIREIKNKPLFILAAVACVWTLLVIVLGAYVRLSHAGLGCPDWPGCYGHMVIPESSEKIMAANERYSERPLHAAKAWKEMIHRYFAGGLGLLILLLAVFSVKYHGKSKNIILPVSILGLIIFQALLGMWTVTLLLKPMIVTAHLLGGMTTFALVVWLMLSYIEWSAPGIEWPQLKPVWLLMLSGMGLLVLQIALGGWISSNYAALACYGFPQCNGQWWPPMDFKDAFILWRGLGIDYEGGVLNHPARVAIHMTHRIGALLVFVVMAGLSFLLWLRIKSRELTVSALLLFILLCLQIALGIANVTLGLPLAVATAHNALAALLLALMVYLLYRLKRLKDVAI